MNKRDLVSSISKETGFMQKDCLCVVSCVFDCIKNNIVKGEDVSIAGFGKFSKKERKSRNVMNPKTKKMMTTEASMQPSFKAAKEFKECVNKKSNKKK